MNDVAGKGPASPSRAVPALDSKRELYKALLDAVGNRLLELDREGDSGGHRRQEPDRTRLPGLLPVGGRRPRGLPSAVRQRHVQRRRVRSRCCEDHRRSRQCGRAADRGRHLRTTRRTLAHALSAIAEGASRRLVELGDESDPDQIATQVSTLAWAGLRALSSAEHPAASAASSVRGRRPAPDPQPHPDPERRPRELVMSWAPPELTRTATGSPALS